MPTTLRHRQPATRRLLLALLVGLCLQAAVAQDAPEGTPQMDLPRATLRAGMHQLDVQRATTPPTRQIGLMYRRQMPSYEGMLFEFEQPGRQCFWMKNTLIPLTAAFLADDGTIVNLADMQPLDLASHCSTQPVRYVLETNQGWFEQRNLRAGHRLQGTMFSRTP